MSEMLEKVARAICRPVYEMSMRGQTPGVIDKYIEINWPNHLDQARAAVEALREPSEGMVEAGSFAVEADVITTFQAIRSAKDAFTAMIDHILKEG